LADLEERAAASEALRAENDALRALVNVVGTSSEETGGGVTVPVVSSTRSSPYGTFLIGAGVLDGITQNSIVLTSGGFVIGTVTDTASHTAVVTEVFAPAASIDASVNGAPASVLGSGGGNAHTKVPRDLAVAVGDPVFAAVFEQRAIGVVGAVASSSASASQDVYIRLPVNLAALQYVYIIPAR
jgi:cell shape-determining protein MreC